jgi:hypothetical protein
MTFIGYEPIVTNITDRKGIREMTKYGYTIRHIETWHDEEENTFIVWDAPPETSDIEINTLPF